MIYMNMAVTWKLMRSNLSTTVSVSCLGTETLSHCACAVSCIWDLKVVMLATTYFYYCTNVSILTIGGAGGGIMAEGPGVGTTSGRLYTVGC